MDNVKKAGVSIGIKILLIVVGVLLIVGGIFQIFKGKNNGSLSLNKQDSALVSKFNELQDPLAKMSSDFADISTLLKGVSDKEQNKDYSGIVSDLKSALTKLDDATSANSSMVPKLSEFSALIASSSADIKLNGSYFGIAYVSSSFAWTKVISDTKALINLTLPYYEGLASGKKVTIDNTELQSALEKMTSDSKIVSDNDAKIASTSKAFAKSAGFNLESK